MNIMLSTLDIPMKKLIHGELEIYGLYHNCKMLFNQFLVYYEDCVRLKKLEPLEDLSQEEKQQIWDFSVSITPLKEERIKVCKVSYVIDYMVTYFYS